MDQSLAHLPNKMQIRNNLSSNKHVSIVFFFFFNLETLHLPIEQ